MRKIVVLFGLVSASIVAQTHSDKTKDIEEVVLNKPVSIKNQLEKEGFAVNVVETKEMAMRNVQTTELLDRTAGLRLRQDGGLGSRINFNINGMTGNAIKVFIDGVPASNYGRSFSINSIPPALIERIEVYKGVVPGYLSEDALGGAINVVLKKQARNLLNVSYSFGSFNTHQANANASYRDKKGMLVDISGFYNYSDNNYEVWGDQITFVDYQGRLTRGHKARRFNDAFRSYGTKIDFGWEGVKWADRFTIGGVFSNDYKEIQHGITMQRVFGDRHSRREANIATLNYRKKDLFTKGLSLNVDASYAHRIVQAIDTVGIMYDWQGAILRPDGSLVRYSSGAEQGDRKTDVKNTNKSFVMRANVGYEITDSNKLFINQLYNNFKRGVADSYLPLGLQLLQNTRDLEKSITTVTYENLALNQRLRTNVFYKYYRQKVTSNEPYQVSSIPLAYDVNKREKIEEYNGFGGAISYAVSKKFFVLASAEQAIRFPNEDEIFGSPDNLINPSDLDAEKSFNANIGVNFSGITLGKHTLRGTLSLFYRDTRGMIRQAESTGNSGTTYYENLEDVLSRGVDVELNYAYANQLHIGLNVSKFDVLFNTEYNSKGERYLYYRKQIRNEPSFKFNANATYYFDNFLQQGSRASLHYNVHFVESFLRNWSNVGLNNLDIIPTQFSNDIGFTYAFPKRKVAISIDAKNIFNQQLFDNFGLQKPGRAFFGKVTYNIF
ncbi:MAG: TonB-dependent receptor plug domain-containing protein [Bergeyella zoohelcum]|nr:TonB-dependent receptor plug domain-containing protein [Bergeyella zoohelcum]